jgi:Leucine-rich repeat (LRR) protein
MVLLMTVASTTADNGTACPKGCSCSVLDSYVDSSSVTCSYLALSDAPAILDATTVHTLDLSNNGISILRNASFSNYSRLSALRLSYNEINEIQLNAFAGLRMMRDLDLRYNNLKSFNPEIFSSNPVLENVSLQGNPIAFVSSDSPILTSASVSFLDLSHCSLITVHPVTFSRLPNLYSLDLSSNLLRTISVTAFEKLPKLRILKLNDNRWTCNCDIVKVMQWITARREQAPAHKPIKCSVGQTYRKFWSIAGRNPCNVSTTTEAIAVNEPEFTTDMTVDLPTASVIIPHSSKAVLHTTSQRILERSVTSDAELRTAPENKTAGWATLLSWNVNTLCVFIILPITLGVAVFLSLIAVNYITKRRAFRRPQHEIRGKDEHLPVCSFHVPFLNPRLTTDIMKSHAGYDYKKIDNSVGGTDYHMYERID